MTVHDEADSSDTAAPSTRSAPLAGRRGWLALGLLFLIGALVYLPALRSPFLLDDYLHASMIDGTFPARRGPFDLYNFVNDTDRAVLIERGMLPWWSHPKLVIRFFRPLSSALLWADHRLLGNSPLPLHLHSFAWWAAAVLAARALFQRCFSSRVTWFATVIFALAPCHALPLAWLANREALVSLTFGALGLASYLRWREERAPLEGALAAAASTGSRSAASSSRSRSSAAARRSCGAAPASWPSSCRRRRTSTRGRRAATAPSARGSTPILSASPPRSFALRLEGW